MSRAKRAIDEEGLLGTGAQADRRARSTPRLFAVVAIGATLTVIAAIGAALITKSPASKIAEAHPPPQSVITATVQLRVLEDEIVVRGKIARTTSTDIPGNAGTTDSTSPIVTRLLVRPGATVRVGQVLAEVSGRPVVLLPGRLPVYRDLRPGTTGADVAQLQAALRDLDYVVTDPARFYGPSTKAAVATMYQDRGYDALPASADDPDTERDAQTAVTAARRSRDEAARVLRGATGPDERSTARAALAYAEEDLHRAEEDLGKILEEVGPMLPAGEIVYINTPSARLSKFNVGVGKPVSGPIGTLETGPVFLTAGVRPAQVSAIRPGMPVQALSEAQGLVVKGYVTSVGAEPGADGLVKVRARLQRPYDDKVVGREVRITFARAATAGPELVVPLSAVSAQASGKTIVSVIRSGEAVAVPVGIGVSGAGYVSVRPENADALHEGDKVVVGRR